MKNNIKELEARQMETEELIYKIAAEKGLITPDLEPITDGVADPQGYLDSFRKIALILKDPYDDVNDGRPCGGGYSHTRDCLMDETKRKIVKTWRIMIYVLYGAKNNLWWRQIPYFSEHPEMIKMLQQIVWINLSKMPGFSSSDPKAIKSAYSLHWRPVVHKQIEDTDPEVLLFLGTFDLCLDDEGKNDFLPDDCELIKTQYLYGNLEETIDAIRKNPSQPFRNRKIEVYKAKGKFIIKAPHPACFPMTGEKDFEEQYVNVLIDIIRNLPKQ